MKQSDYDELVEKYGQKAYDRAHELHEQKDDPDYDGADIELDEAITDVTCSSKADGANLPEPKLDEDKLVSIVMDELHHNDIPDWKMADVIDLADTAPEMVRGLGRIAFAEDVTAEAQSIFRDKGEAFL